MNKKYLEVQWHETTITVLTYSVGQGCEQNTAGDLSLMAPQESWRLGTGERAIHSSVWWLMLAVSWGPPLLTTWSRPCGRAARCLGLRSMAARASTGEKEWEAGRSFVLFMIKSLRSHSVGRLSFSLGQSSHKHWSGLKRKKHRPFISAGKHYNMILKHTGAHTRTQHRRCYLPPVRRCYQLCQLFSLAFKLSQILQCEPFQMVPMSFWCHSMSLCVLPCFLAHHDTTD